MSGWWQRVVLGVLLAGAWGTVLADALPVLALARPREVTVADGLPSSTITAMTEDRLGYLWFASTDGLARFDGRDFRLWRSEDGLRDNALWSLHVDASNQLWVGTSNAGLIRFSPDRRQVRYIDRTTHPSLGSNTIFVITSTPDGALWFGTDTAGLYRLDTNGTLRNFRPEPDNPHSLPSVLVGQLAVDTEGDLWVGTAAGVARWNGTGFDRMDMSMLDNPSVNGLRLDRHGRLWVGTPSGALMRSRDGTVTRQNLSPGDGHPVLQMLLQDRRGDFWYETARQVVRSGDNRHAEPVAFFSSVLEDEAARNVSFIHEDHDGGLWFSMIEGGLWHLPSSWRQFVQLRGKRTAASGLHNPRVVSLAPSGKGGLWLVGTAGDLDHLDPVTGQVEHHVASTPGSLWMRSVLEDSAGKVWIGRKELLERYDPSSGERRQWTREGEDPTLVGSLVRMVACSPGEFWLQSGEGRVQQRDLEGRVLWSSEQSAEHLQGNDLLKLACGPDRQPWLATRKGLLHWQPGAKDFVPVPGSPAQTVHALHVDGQSVLWVGYAGALGQYRWRNGELQAIDRIDARHGFPAIVPLGVVVDPNGSVWVSSTRGLLRVQPVTRSVRLFGVHDGLRSQEFVPGTLGITPSGQVYAASDYGVVFVDDDEFGQGSRRPPLVVEQVSARLGEEQVDLTHLTSLVIDPDMRDLQFTARLLSFKDAESTSYRFKLEGYDPEWVEVGVTGQRLFSRLSAGHYRLLVQARNGNNVLTDIHEIQIQVLPPWWASTPGVVLYVVLAGGILFVAQWLYRRRLKRSNELALARTRRELAEQTAETKTRFLANFGHEVRTPLTGVLGMSELLLSAQLAPREQGYARSIQQAGEHLLRLVNDALDMARIEAGKLELRSEPFPVQGLIDQVMALMLPLARGKRLALRQAGRLDDGILVQGDVLRLRQIVLNLIGNAIKFTESGEVVVQAGVGEDGEGVWLSVSDTGPGMSEAQQQRLFHRFEQAEGALTTQRYGGSGLGLAISQELAAAMGGRISVQSRLGEGACFRVTLPLAWSRASPGVVAAADADSVPVRQILLVEDDPTIAAVVTALLSERGHVVVHAAHGLTALAELVGAPFDVALLDLDLPGMDGLALAAQIRQLGLRLPLLAVTARADAEARLLAEAAGFQGFLRKPVTGQLLAEAIETVLADAPPVLVAGAVYSPVEGVSLSAPR